MAVHSSFFNSVGGDRIYDAEVFASYFASFIGNGVFPTPSTNLQVSQLSNLQTYIRPGKGWINGYYVTNDSDFVLQHTVADGALDRIDRIVMALNLGTREITFYVKRGTPATNPIAPSLVRDGTLTELALADVRVNRGALVITQSNITDTRPNNTLCGIVRGTVQEIDATNLFAQYDSRFNEFISSLEDVLSGDVASNLLQMIQANETTINDHVNNQAIHVAPGEKTIWNNKVNPDLYSTTMVSGLSRVGNGLLSGANGLVSLDFNAVPKNLKLLQNIPITTAIAANGRLTINNVSQYDVLKIVIIGNSNTNGVLNISLTAENTAFATRFTLSQATVTNLTSNTNVLSLGSLGANSVKQGNIDIDILWNGTQSVISAMSSYITTGSQGVLDIARGFNPIKLTAPELRFSTGLAAGSTIIVYGGDYN